MSKQNTEQKSEDKKSQGFSTQFIQKIAAELQAVRPINANSGKAPSN